MMENETGCLKSVIVLIGGLYLISFFVQRLCWSCRSAVTR